MKLVLVIIFGSTLAHAADVPITQDELVRRTQELYDAIVPGNQAPWQNISPTIASSPTKKAGPSIKPTLSFAAFCRRSLSFGSFSWRYSQG
jgi:hypothetical protein